MGVELEVEGVDEATVEVGSLEAKLEMEGVDHSGGAALVEPLKAAFSPEFVETESSQGVHWWNHSWIQKH